jgi:hypothetical protein
MTAEFTNTTPVCRRLELFSKQRKTFLFSKRTMYVIRGVVNIYNAGVTYKLTTAWRSGHNIRLRNEKNQVRIPPGFKVFGKHSRAVVYKMT